MGDMPIQLEKVGFSVSVDDPVIFKTDFDNYAFLYCGKRFKTVVESLDWPGFHLRRWNEELRLCGILVVAQSLADIRGSLLLCLGTYAYRQLRSLQILSGQLV